LRILIHAILAAPLVESSPLDRAFDESGRWVALEILAQFNRDGHKIVKFDAQRRIPGDDKRGLIFD